MAEEVLYPLDKEKIYTSSDPLTLETDGVPMTLKMGAWLNEDPVRIHKMIVREKTLQVDTFEVLNPLVSKLRKSDPDYYKKFMGLQLVIDYPGYSAGIKAKIPFENDPVGFYRWWRKGKHEEKVYLSLGYQVMLSQKVALLDPKVMLKKDFEMVR